MHMLSGFVHNMCCQKQENWVTQKIKMNRMCNWTAEFSENVHGKNIKNRYSEEGHWDVYVKGMSRCEDELKCIHTQAMHVMFSSAPFCSKEKSMIRIYWSKSHSILFFETGVREWCLTLAFLQVSWTSRGGWAWQIIHTDMSNNSQI